MLCIYKYTFTRSLCEDICLREEQLTKLTKSICERLQRIIRISTAKYR